MNVKVKYILGFVTLLFMQGLVAQTITGTVTDNTGVPLPGANVIEKGTTNGASTDFDGNYTLELTTSNPVITFSSLGFLTKDVTVGGQTMINMKMEEDAQQLGEVVVTALGITKDQRKLGYSVTEVDGDGLTQARETNVANGLVGKVSGLSIKQTNSGPGGTAKILLRGLSSANTGSTSPLFVIDGVPMDNTQRGSAGEWGGSDGGDGIGNLNPDDIESMTVLKGQSASALYGSRASNGVIMVTTKKGSKGDYSITLNSNFQVEKAIDLTDFQSVYGQGINGLKPGSAAIAQATNRRSWGARLDGSDVIGYDGNTYSYSKAGNSYIDFYDTGNTFTNTLSVSKGVGDGSFRLSLSNLNSESIVPNSGLDRITVNLTADQNITDKLNVSATVNYTDERYDNQPFLSDGPKNPTNFYLLAPNVDHTIFAPGFDENGQEIIFSDDAYATNPYFITNQGINDPNRKRFISILSSKYSFTDDTYALLRLGNDTSNDTFFSVDPYGLAYLSEANSNGNLSGKGQSTRSELNIDGIFGTNFSITEDFEVDALAGATLRRNKYQTVGVSGGPFIFPYLYSPLNVVNIGRSYDYEEKEVQSGYYSFDFSYKNFLTVTTTGRYDVYSTLPENNNSIFTPSVTTSFIFDDFLNIDALSFGKLRASYAVTSGEPGAAYGTSFYYTAGNSINGVATGSSPSDLPNLALKPFTLDEFEVGLNLKMFNNKLGLDLAYFVKTSHDEIYNANYSAASGFNKGVVATGSLQNKGLEVLLTGSPVTTENFSWNSSFNFTYLKNEVLQTDTDNNPLTLGTNRAVVGAATTAMVVGEAGPQIRAYDYAYNDDGSIQYDSEGLPVRGELKSFGQVLPKFYGGFNNDFSYKNFNLAFLVDFNYGNKVLSATEYYARFNGLSKATLVGRENGLTNDGVTVDAQTYYQNEIQRINSKSVVDGDFIKLRQVTLGYSFPSEMFDNVKFFEGIRVSLVARNLAILWRKAENIDPESSFGSTVNFLGIEGGSLPSSRSLGLNVNFKIK
ncbi:TonB-linked SusC/RagA family outer membrane protein [Leeuwenhoekiella aestuarii]|uniref:SusC/RagA family TonB-linked outer membrane protein n=1 Tax=Leeuwenhoekiella aestuarii TaxID=2249426 RepID=UPI000FFF1F5D|nr:SusC/RagA family TonB-linked outer membrane protein [Leeuwenhoekiella aestuarii]RXG16069.1 TonB-linked SusC/RagA family outer membrane protein [Leeuwenhoekiella aestuarii]